MDEAKCNEVSNSANELKNQCKEELNKVVPLLKKGEESLEKIK